MMRVLPPASVLVLIGALFGGFIGHPIWGGLAVALVLALSVGGLLLTPNTNK